MFDEGIKERFASSVDFPDAAEGGMAEDDGIRGDGHFFKLFFYGFFCMHGWYGSFFFCVFVFGYIISHSVGDFYGERGLFLRLLTAGDFN